MALKENVKKMTDTKRIKRALVSVYHKDGLDEILRKLHEEGVTFVSTGGTQKFIESLGIPCDAVEDLTGYPSILGGRVKTLHPKVFGGILARRDNETDNSRNDRTEEQIELCRLEDQLADRVKAQRERQPKRTARR